MSCREFERQDLVTRCFLGAFLAMLYAIAIAGLLSSPATPFRLVFASTCLISAFAVYVIGKLGGEA